MDASDKQSTPSQLSSLVLRSSVTVLLGAVALVWPKATLLVLAYLFSLLLLATGTISLLGSLIYRRDHDYALWRRIAGIVVGGVEISVGVYLLRNAHASLATLVVLIAFVLVVRGIMEFGSGLLERHGPAYRIFAATVATLVVVVGTVLLLRPESAGVVFIWLLGLYALVTGPILITLALAVKSKFETISGRRELTAKPSGKNKS